MTFRTIQLDKLKFDQFEKLAFWSILLRRLYSVPSARDVLAFGPPIGLKFPKFSVVLIVRMRRKTTRSQKAHRHVNYNFEKQNRLNRSCFRKPLKSISTRVPHNSPTFQPRLAAPSLRNKSSQTRTQQNAKTNPLRHNPITRTASPSPHKFPYITQRQTAPGTPRKALASLSPGNNFPSMLWVYYTHGTDRTIRDAIPRVVHCATLRAH